MHRKVYSKPHLNHEEQLNRLIERGLLIDNKDEALRTLNHINYYRLGVYRYHFEQDHATHKLRKGTNLNDILALYEFDRELRLLVLDAIERIEVSFRTQWAYHLSANYGSQAHLNKGIHKSQYMGEMKKSLLQAIELSRETFIRDFKKKYKQNSLPIWIVSEIISFGLLSKWYKNSLPHNKARKAIAKFYDLYPGFLESWMQHLCVVRNVCAHHSQLWNCNNRIPRPRLLKFGKKVTKSDLPNIFAQFSDTMTIISHLLDIILPENDWREQCIALYEKHFEQPNQK